MDRRGFNNQDLVMDNSKSETKKKHVVFNFRDVYMNVFDKYFKWVNVFTARQFVAVKCPPAHFILLV